MTCAAPVQSFAAVRSLWEEILVRRPWNSVFLTPAWQETWWDEFGREDELRLFTVGPEDAPLGVAPMLLRGDRLTFLGDTDLFDYHDFITADPAFYPALFDCLEQEPWRTMELTSAPEWTSTFELLPRAARERGHHVRVEHEDVAPGIELPGSWDEYLAGLRKKDRHELRRKLRRLESAGEIALRLAEGPTFDRDLELFQQVMAESREEKREFLTRERQAFFVRMAGRMRDLGLLKLFLLELDGIPIASVLTFDYGGHRLLYNSGYLHEYGRLAPGLLLKALCIRDAIESGLTYFDLLRGAEAYKHHLGAVDHSVYRIVVVR